MRITDKQYDVLIKMFGDNEHHRHCDYCGRRIFSHDRLMPWRAHYCSIECKEDAAIKRRKEKRAEGRKGIKCLNCGKIFTPARNDAKYCSPACKQEAYRIRAAKQ